MSGFKCGFVRFKIAYMLLAFPYININAMNHTDLSLFVFVKDGQTRKSYKYTF